jgi:hypothetical protein
MLMLPATDDALSGSHLRFWFAGMEVLHNDVHLSIDSATMGMPDLAKYLWRRTGAWRVLRQFGIYLTLRGFSSL